MNKRLLRVLSLAASMAVTVPASTVWAQSASPADIIVTDAWVRATVPTQKATGAFMQLRSAAGSRLVEVKSPAAGVAEVHEMKMSGDVMQMRHIDALALPAGQTVKLSPGGYHVMLMQLKQQLKPGDTVALTLVVEGAGGQRQDIPLEVPVRALNAK